MIVSPFIRLSADFAQVDGAIYRWQSGLLFLNGVPVGQPCGSLVYMLDGGTPMPTNLADAIALAEAGFVNTGTGDITTNVVSDRAYESNTGVAPYGVHFDATGTTTALTANPFRDLIYVFYFGDDDTATWSYGTRPGVAKRNLARGAIAAHVFETPGTRTVKCTPMYVSSGGVLSVGATQSITITIQDPDVVFAGANTIAIANGTLPVAGVDGVPLGATCLNITTHAGIVAQMNSGNGKRILLKRGDTWPQTTTGAITTNGPSILAAYGTGAKPTISCSVASIAFTSSTANAATDWRLVDIAYNATPLATGSARQGTRLWSHGEGSGITAGKRATLLRCTSTDAGTPFFVTEGSVVADCDAPIVDGGNGNVGVFCQEVDRIAVLGCNFPNALAAEHCMRLQGTRYSVVSNCTMTQPANTKHAFTLRGYSTGTTWDGIYTEFVIVSDNVMTAPSTTTQAVKVASTSGTIDERFRDIILERNYIEAIPVYGFNLVISGGERMTVRNSLFRMPSQGIAIGLTRGLDATVPLNDVVSYNNTFYSSVAGSQLIAGVNMTQAEITNVVVKNCLMYAPLHTSGKKVLNATAGTSSASNNTPDANIATVSPQFAVTPPVTYADWTPGSASYAKGAGAWVPVFDDFFWAARMGTPSMGAIIPA